MKMLPACCTDFFIQLVYTRYTVHTVYLSIEQQWRRPMQRPPLVVVPQRVLEDPLDALLAHGNAGHVGDHMEEDKEHQEKRGGRRRGHL